MSRHKTRAISMMGLLIALHIILTRYISIETPFMRISFVFIAIGFMGLFFNPLFAGLGNALADFLGITLFSKSAAPFFPGFTVSAFLSGMIYSLFLHNKKVTLPRLLLLELVISVVIELILNTVWLYILLGPGILAQIPVRITKILIMYPIKVIILYILTNKTSLSKFKL